MPTRPPDVPKGGRKEAREGRHQAKELRKRRQKGKNYISIENSLCLSLGSLTRTSVWRLLCPRTPPGIQMSLVPVSSQGSPLEDAAFVPPGCLFPSAQVSLLHTRRNASLAEGPTGQLCPSGAGAGPCATAFEFRGRTLAASLSPRSSEAHGAHCCSAASSLTARLPGRGRRCSGYKAEETAMLSPHGEAKLPSAGQASLLSLSLSSAGTRRRPQESSQGAALPGTRPWCPQLGQG